MNDHVPELNSLIGHLFRHHSGKMAAVLSRTFGVRHIDLIEDGIQDAMIAAMKRWPFTGVPENPTAWLTQVAKNRTIDRLRRESTSQNFDDEFDVAIDASQNAQFEGEVVDDQLRMIFACCHPSIPPDSQVALTLKIVGGFSGGEIARSFLASQESVAKLLTRAKSKLRDGDVSLEIPVGDELTKRLSPVLKVLYLMFNEGYAPTTGDEVVRRDLCFEAIRLVGLLTSQKVTRIPKADALAALFYFHAARFPARVGSDGEMLVLGDQDRSSWDREMIGRGFEHLLASASGDEVSDYHLQAEIASLHATSQDLASTDWRRIVECYDILQSRNYSPVVELNRVIALSRLDGTSQAFAELEKIEQSGRLDSYFLFYATKARFLSDLARPREAAMSFEKALSLALNESARNLLTKNMAKLTELTERE